ncbi:MAG: tetratricopeptide repeat protein, partial [Gammaproteobacteria bacterium]|nr:tetratricopeptide repeat protein [candidate division Zixibacteria bacterium]NIR94955.1 tetratricopeptide repeat protein [Gammaproteobacteria bacterium]NIT59560.1 tetratricopeptide repeat protein [Fodinibius sp.]NIS47570.1 tetratricopeptide repeat protein [candidate division Zixibacteria bacterium]NIU16857.1 tetratricopeptide repeat protein [candidate division Zixibacteria bacterium]
YTAIKTGDLEHAENAAKQALSIKDDYAPTLICLANIYRHKKDYEFAEDYFNQAAKLSPDAEEVWTGL